MPAHAHGTCIATQHKPLDQLNPQQPTNCPALCRHWEAQCLLRWHPQGELPLFYCRMALPMLCVEVVAVHVDVLCRLSRLPPFLAGAVPLPATHVWTCALPHNRTQLLHGLSGNNANLKRNQQTKKPVNNELVNSPAITVIESHLMQTSQTPNGRAQRHPHKHHAFTNMG